MKTFKEIDIKYYDNSGNVQVRCTVPVTQEASVHYELMQSHYCKLSFNLSRPTYFLRGDFIETPYGRFELIDLTKAKDNDTIGYSYEIQFDAYYRKLKNKILKYRPNTGSQEATFSLTSKISTHIEVIMKNLAYYAKLDKSYLYDPNFEGEGTDYTYVIDASVDANAAKLITYYNTSILDAIANIAQTFGCEWWFEGNILHFGTCENTNAITDFRLNDNIVSMSSSQSQSTYANRVYAFGAARNLPSGYKNDSDADITKDGVVEKRLMLPTSAECSEQNKQMLAENGFELNNGYIQVGGLHEDQYVEGVTTNDDIYPRNLIKTSKVTSYEKDVEDESTPEEGDYIKRTFYRVNSLAIVNEDGEKTGDMAFRKAYILSGKNLHIVFQSGSLSGMNFECEFNPDGVSEILKDDDGNPILKDGKEQINPKSQVFEIVANEDYGRFLPDITLHPKDGDTFVLYNWDSTKLGDTLVSSASNELLTDAIKDLKKSMIDPTTYTCTAEANYSYNQGRGNLHGVGDRVNLYNKGYGDSYRASRIIGYEFCLDIPYDGAKYYVGEKPSYSRLNAMESKIEELVYNGQSYLNGNGGSGRSIYIIKSYDSITPTDYNVFSAKAVDEQRLNKTKDDTAKGTITWEKVQKLLSGLLVGNFNNENGGSWTPDTEGRSHLITDYLEVRMKAIFEELVIKKTSTIGGKEIISPAGGVVAHKVEEVTVTYNNVSQKAYRCYFLAEQEGDAVDNDFSVNDQVRSESFNVRKGTYHKVGNHFYWRLVIGRDEEPVELEGKKYHYIDLSDTDCATASDVPAKGDVLSQCGNRTDVERQNCLIFSAVDTYSPSVSLYHGINSYSFANKEYVEYGVNKQTNKAFFNVYGDMYVGDRPTKENGYEGSSYIKYDSAAKQVSVKGKISAKSTVDGKELSQYIKENSAGGLTEEQVNNLIKNSQVIADLQNQVDGAIETWFYDGVPTLKNAPASSWTTDKEKDTHLGDLYYDNKTGKAYRFAKDGNTYKWTIITDTDIAKALSDASKAQETADGKMKVFSTQPIPPYQLGDIWVNATYPTDGNIYKNEILRCQTAKAKGSSFDIADWTKASKYTDDSALNTFKEEYKNDMASYKEQLDEKVETWFYNYAPTTQNKPASDWTTDTLKSQHAGDLFYNTSNGYTYRWTGTAWARIKDNDINTAMTAASKAQDTADGKRTVFTSQPTVPYDEGDLWASGGDDGKTLMVCVKSRATGSFTSSEWVKANDSDLNAFAKTIEESLTGIRDQLDKKAETWYQPSDPSTSWTTDDAKKEHKGDLWYNTSNNQTFFWNGTKWDKQDVPTEVFDKIDGKSSIYVSKPASYEERDLWILEAAYTLGGVAYSKGELVVATKSNASFSAADWTKKVKYTDDTVANAAKKAAEEAKKAADTAQTNVTNLGKTVTSNKKAFDNYVTDGYLEPSEIAAMAQDSKRLEDAFAAAQKSYNEVKEAEVLTNTNELTDLNTAFTTLSTAKTELITYLSDISARYNAANTEGKATIVSAVGTKFTNFQSAYSAFYDKLGLANAYITSKIYGDLKQNITDLAGYKYIKDALGQTTDIDGGLVMTTLLALRDADGNVQSGINGAIDTNRGKKSIATWWGGQMVDKDYNSGSLTPATSLVRFDGSGYLANGAIWWDVDGKVHADPTSFIISEKNLGAYLAFFEPTWKSGSNGTNIKDLVALTPQAPFTTLSVSNDLLVEGKLKLGSITLSVVNGALKIDGNVYSTGGMSAYGDGTNNGGGGGLVASVKSYTDIIKGTYTDNDLASIPNAYAIKALSNRIDNISSELGGLSLDWANITGKPSTFTPSAHTHKWVDITDRITKVSQLTNDSGYTTNKGTVTSVKLTLPTGLSLGTTKEITTSGTFAISLTSGYSIPTTSKQGQWDSAYNWYKLMTTDEETADGVINKWNEVVDFLAGIAQTDSLDSILSGINKSITDETNRAKKAEGANATNIATNKANITTLQGYFTNGSAKSAIKLTNARKLWGNSFDGTADISGSIVVPSGKYITIGNIKLEYDATNKALKITNTSTNEVANLYTSGGVSAYGVGTTSSGSTGGGGLNGTVKSYNDAKSLTSESLSEVASAYSVAALYSSINDAIGRINTLEGGSATSIEVTGSGNAVTGVSKSGTKLTFTKGATFLTSHQDISGKSDKTHTHSVKINGVTKTIAATGGTAVDLGTYLTSHQSLAAYLKSADAEKTYSKLGHTHAFSEITGKPTTLAGYGVTDGVNTVTFSGSGNAVTSASIDGHTLTLTKGSTFSLSGHTHTFASLTSKPTTIAGYGITDAYTKAQVDSTIAKYLPLAGGTITGVLTVNGIATFKSKVAIGDIYIINDGSGNLYVQKTDGKTAANFYATGGITAFGASSVSGGTGSGLNGSVLGFEKATAMTSADNGDSSKTEVSFLATAWSIKQLNDKINAFGTGVFSDYLTIAAAKATYQPKGNYLTSHQTIYGLTIQKNGTSLGTYTPNSAAKTINVTVPTKLSELSNDSGYTKNTGTVTSVAISVPTGLSVSGSPITTNGTIAIALASGYSIPTTAKQTAWDGAVSAKHTHSNKSVLDGISSTKVSHWNSAYDWYALMTTDEETADGIINKWNEVVSFLANIAQTDTLSGIVDGINKSISDEVARAKKAEGVNASGISANKGSIATLQGYFTNGSAKKALQLTNARKLWGNSFNGTADINGSIIVPSGKYISIGNIKLEYDAANKALKITNTTTNEVANLYTSGGVSAYGVGASSSSGGGLNGSVKAYADAIRLTTENLSEIASAYSVAKLYSEIQNLASAVPSISVSVPTGGNALTGATYDASTGTITFTKGTFLTAHQSLDSYVNEIAVSGTGNAITAVSKSGKKVTFTKGATYLTAHQSLAAYATQNWVKNEATAHNADMVDNYHASGLFTGFSISDVANKVTISIGGTSKALNLVRAFPSGVGNNFNDIATHGNSMGMSNIAAPYASSTANYQTLNGYVNPNGQTGWHHYINLSYTDSNNTATSPNMWQTQFAIKAGTTEVYVRSRAGGKISNDAAWAAPWVRLARVTDNVASASKVANALSWSGYSSGSYNGSAAKSISIPNNTNQLTNGAGFITASASISGNAGSATKLQNSRTINGTSFNGTANIVTSYWGTTRKLWGNSVNGNADVNGSITIANTDGVYVQIGDVRLVYDKANTAIKVVKSDGTTAANFYATGGITAYGEGSGSSGGGGLNGSVKSYADALKLASESLSEIASAYSIKALDSRISSLEGGSATSIETTGSGNAVTSVSKSGTKITFTKGSTFSLNGHTHTFASLTSKPTSLSGYGITDGVNAVSVTGSGNAVTAASVSGHTLTLTKGSTFSLSNHTHYVGTTQVQGSSAEQALTGITKIDNILKLSKATVTVNTSYKAEQNRLVIYGNTYGNDANYIKSARKLSYGDGGPQLVFSTSENPDASGVQSAALVYTDHDTIGAGVSLSFVTNQGDAYFIAPHIKALTAFQGNLAWSYITNKPTTLSGFGITDGLRSVTHPSGSNVFVTGISTSGTAITYTKSYTKKSLSAVGTSGWTNASIDGNIIPDMSFIAYWNGAYSGTSSNLAYCNKGAFGSFAIKNSLAFSELTSKPTTISGYGITDAYTKSQVDAIAAKYLPLTGGTLTGQLKIVASALNGAYNGLRIGDDCYIGDCNFGNTIGLMGVNNNNAGMVKFGKGGMQFGYNGSNHIASTTAQWTNLNADLLDGWHKDNIVWSGAVNSNTASLSHYWAKLFDITVTGNQYDDRSFTFLFSNGYNDTYSVVVLRIRQNGAKDSGAYNFSISLRELVGNMSSRLRVYYNNATGNVQLWGNCQGQYGSLSYTIIKKTGRTSADFTSQGTLVTNTSFSEAQSLPATTGDSPYTLLDGATRIGIVKQADQLVTARSLWGQSFNGTANVSGNMTGVGNINTSAAPAGTIYTNNWFRSKGSTGWYSEDHGGGWYMIDNTWIRSYGGKDVYLSNKLSVNGNVGIGTSAPSHKLHVLGEIYTTTKVNINGIILEKDSNGDLKVNGNLYATGGISAYGTSSAGSGGGLNGSVKSYADALKLTSESLSEIASAYSIKQLSTRITSLEGGSATSISVSGSGNAVTSITKNGTTITVTKGATFLTAHQSLSAYMKTADAKSLFLYHTRENIVTDLDNFNTRGASHIYEMNDVTNTPTDNGWLQVMNWGSADADYGMLLANDYNINGSLYFRHKVAGKWNAWKTLIDSSNIANQSVKYATTAGTAKNPNALSWSGYASGSYDGSVAKSISIPNNTNQLTNGAGFITASASITGNAATATKVNHSLSVFGKSFNGSADVTVADTDLIASISTATANLTDKTEILTSYASDNGFNDSNAKNRIYRRPASAIWGYINSKTISNADKLDNVHLNGIFTALSNTNNGVSMTIGTVAKSLANMQVYSATKLATARNIALGHDFRGSANFDGTGNITINGHINAAIISLGPTDPSPFKRIAHVQVSGSWNDNALLLYLSQGYIGGFFGICRVEFGTNDVSEAGSASASVKWLFRQGYATDYVQVGFYSAKHNSYMDVFVKTTGGYQGTVIRCLQDSRGSINSNVSLLKATATTEAYTSIEAAATALYKLAYTAIVKGSDAGAVNYANSAGNAGTLDGIHANGLFTNLSNNGNNLSITIGGTNKTLTVGYATKAAQLNTARTLWGQSFDGTGNVNGALSGATTISASNTISTTLQNGALKIGNKSTPISAIDEQVIFNTGGAIRFGETAWDWNQWAGLKYNHSSKTIYLGIADGSVFNAKSAQSGGMLKLINCGLEVPDNIAMSGVLTVGKNIRLVNMATNVSALFAQLNGDSLSIGYGSRMHATTQMWCNKFAIYCNEGIVLLNIDKVTATFKTNILATGGVTAYASSDARLKTDLRKLDYLGIIKAMGGTFGFAWKKDNTRSIGWIAQHVLCNPHLKDIVETDEKGYYKINYWSPKLIATAFGAIEQVGDEVSRLKARVVFLESEVQRLSGKQDGNNKKRLDNKNINLLN
nr:MAG TPA: tail protein [Caudoviricetes sp.]